MKNLASLRQECTHIGTSIHRPSEDIRVLVRGLGLADQTTKDAGKRDSLFHSTTRGGGGQGLKMERQVVLDGSTRLDSLNLEGGTDIGKRRGAEGQGLRVVLLPSLVFSAKVESARVLKVGREDDRLVASFSGKLDTQIPGLERHKDEIEIL